MPLHTSVCDHAERLHAEMAVTFGVVPLALTEEAGRADGVAFGKDEFLFETPEQVRFHYMRGRGVVAEVPEGALAEDDFRLYLWGTVFGAVAWLNGFFPLHASAVVVGDSAAAFTADSGGGKSTLAAALAGMGFAHMCDDTLALARCGDRIVGVPDRKPIKLWADAASFLDTATTAEIMGLPGKFYAAPAVRTEDAIPLTDVFLLRAGSQLSITEVADPGERLRILTEAMYRPASAVVVGDEVGHGRWLFDLLRSVRIWILARPTHALDEGDFEKIAEFLRELPAR